MNFFGSNNYPKVRDVLHNMIGVWHDFRKSNSSIVEYEENIKKSHEYQLRTHIETLRGLGVTINENGEFSHPDYPDYRDLCREYICFKVGKRNVDDFLNFVKRVVMNNDQFHSTGSVSLVLNIETEVV